MKINSICRTDILGWTSSPSFVVIEVLPAVRSTKESNEACIYLHQLLLQKFIYT